MLIKDQYKKLSLMGIRFDNEPAPAPAPAPTPEPTPNPVPTPADIAAQEAARKAAESQQQQTETPEQKIARLEAANATLTREKENVRIQKLGQEKAEAKRTELLNVAKLAGVEITDPDKETVETLTQKLTGKVLQGDQSQDEARNAKLELAIYKTAGKVSVNADKLANSLSFMKAIQTLNPADADFEQKLTDAINAELEKDSSLKVSGGTSASGADTMGGAGGSQEVTKEQFAAMSISQKTALFHSNPAAFARLTA